MLVCRRDFSPLTTVACTQPVGRVLDGSHLPIRRRLGNEYPSRTLWGLDDSLKAATFQAKAFFWVCDFSKICCCFFWGVIPVFIWASLMFSPPAITLPLTLKRCQVLLPRSNQPSARVEFCNPALGTDRSARGVVGETGALGPALVVPLKQCFQCLVFDSVGCLERLDLFERLISRSGVTTANSKNHFVLARVFQ